MSAAEIEIAPDLSGLHEAPETVQVAEAPPPRTWGPKWAAAVVRAQARFPRIEKASDATVTSERATYKYSYAELGLILERVQPVLGECGLGLLQDAWTDPCVVPDQDGKAVRATRVTVVTFLLHESGEFREFKPLKHTGIELRIQEVGALISFLRRYSAVTALRVSPFGEDDDAKSVMDRDADKAPSQNPPTAKAQPKSPPKPRGVTITNPRGDAAKNADPKKVKLYVDELVKAATRQDDLSVRQLWDELRADHDATIVVWDRLKKDNPTEFDFIKGTVSPARGSK